MATVSETFDKYGAQLFLAMVSQPEMLCAIRSQNATLRQTAPDKG